jgi:hypothetical protein
MYTRLQDYDLAYDFRLKALGKFMTERGDRLGAADERRTFVKECLVETTPFYWGAASKNGAADRKRADKIVATILFQFLTFWAKHDVGDGLEDFLVQHLECTHAALSGLVERVRCFVSRQE